MGTKNRNSSVNASLPDSQRKFVVRTILELQQKLALEGLTVEDLVGEGRDA